MGTRALTSIGFFQRLQCCLIHQDDDGPSFPAFHEITPMLVWQSVQDQKNPLQDLDDYIKYQWIENPMFTPKDWNTFKYLIRTNNDIEGWN